MATQLAVRTMEDFKDLGLSIGHMVERQCEARTILLASLNFSTDARELSRADLNAMMADLLGVGWSGLKRAHQLLGKAQYKAYFCQSSTPLDMELFKKACFDMVAILEDSGVMAANKQIR